MLGIRSSDYQNKSVVELGCGTGEYTLWYATHGAAEVTGVDLSKGSLAVAEQKRQSGDVRNARFLEKDILKLDLPDNAFDYAYSVGVLHHTGDACRGFQHLCRIARPGGVVVVSLYNSYSCFTLRVKQAICRLLGGMDLDKRARIGRRLFPLTMYSMNKRYHDRNYEQISYDIFAFPHGTFHTASEVLKWFDANNIEYLGSFAPLRLRDYFYAYSLPEYHSFKRTFSGFPMIRLFGSAMNKIATTILRMRPDQPRTFRRPGRLSMLLAQLIWVFVGIRLNCFTIAGRKRA